MEENMSLPFARSLRVTGVLALIALFLLGAPPAHAARSAAKSGPPLNTIKKHGTILYSDWEFPDTLNIFQTGLGVTYETMNSVIEGLDTYDQHAKLVPDMLINIPTIKNHEILNGGKTIILKLRHGMYWSSGEEITNKDVLFGWKMYMDPATGPACVGSCDHIGSISLVGKYEAILHLKDNYAPILAVGLPPVWPHNWPALGLDPHSAAVKLASDTTFNFENSSYWTDGPYQIQTFVNNDRIVLTPMKYYHIHPGPYASKMIFVFYSDKNAEIAAAASGQTDVTTDYTYADLPSLSPGKSRYHLWVTPSFVAEHLEFNCLDPTYNGKPNSLHNLKVRQALALTVDKIGMIESALGLSAKQAKNVVSYTPWTVTPTLKQEFGDTAIKGDWDPLAKKYLPYGPKAIADAKKLLQQAGYGSGFHLDFLTTAGNPTRVAEYGVVARNWAQLGVQTTLNTVPASAFAADWDHNGPRNHGNFQVELWAFGNAPDPDNLKVLFESKFIDRTQTTHSAINDNYSGIDNPLIDEGMAKGATSFNPKVRAKWYKIVQEQLNKGAYWVMLYYRANVVTSDHRIAGDTPYPGTGYFGNEWNPWSWKVVGS
jgi:peptide/nickel transport system substrate-binding protein